RTTPEPRGSGTVTATATPTTPSTRSPLSSTCPMCSLARATTSRTTAAPSARSPPASSASERSSTLRVRADRGFLAGRPRAVECRGCREATAWGLSHEVGPTPAGTSEFGSDVTTTGREQYEQCYACAPPGAPLPRSRDPADAQGCQAL